MEHKMNRADREGPADGNDRMRHAGARDQVLQLQRVETEAVDALQLKGFSKPVDAFRVIART
jgi:hypothetical protein